MVIRDFTNEITELPKGSQAPRLPDFSLGQPVDRLAAVIIDVFMILVPFLMLVCAPFRKELQSASLMNDEMGVALASGAIFIVVIVSFVLYHGLMLHYFGATFGKMFFGLKVVRLWTGEKPKLWTSLVRSFVWFLEIIPLALPHLAVMSNIQRRPLHDRVSDTVVITTKSKRRVGSPNFIESSFAKGVFSAFFMFWGLIFVFMVWREVYDYKNQAYLIPILESEGQLCGIVSEAQAEWPKEAGDDPSRLSVAMGLFAAGEVDKSCLTQEVELVEQQNKLDTLYYLSQSFVNANDSVLSNKYLDEVCALEPKSDDCKMSQVIELWADKKWEEVEMVFKSVKDESRVYIKIWAVRQYLKNAQFDEAQILVSQMPTIPAVSNFMSEQRTKIYWGLKDYEKAQVAAEMAYDSLNPINRIDLSSWMCYEQAAMGCTSMTSKSCDVFNEEILQQPMLLGDGKIAMTFIKQHECKEKVNYKLLAQAFRNTSFGGFVKALDLFKSNKNKESQKILSQLMNDESVETPVREEARRRLIGQAKSIKDLVPFLDDWKKDLGGLEWEKTGLALFNRLNLLKQHKESLVVGENLMPYSKNNTKLQKDLIQSAVKGGESFAAWKMLRSLKKSESLRAPASQDDFDEIQKQLIKEFGEL